jgi:putative transposase
MCRVLDVSRARYYQWRQRPVNRWAAADAVLVPQVRITFAELHRRCGSPRVHRELQARGVCVGKHRVARVMREEGLRAKRPRPFTVTTQSAHAHRIAPNTLQRQFHVARINRVWGADITYLPTAEGWLYFAVVLDLCSRRVVGWAFSSRLEQPLTLRALEMALALRGNVHGVLHHSDRGSQYASRAYRKRLARLACAVA